MDKNPCVQVKREPCMPTFVRGAELAARSVCTPAKQCWASSAGVADKTINAR